MSNARVTVKDWNGNTVDYETAVVMMDDEIREAIHFETPDLAPQAFYDEYCKRHYGKFGEVFMKIKVSELYIIVSGTIDKPYYEIMYKKIGEKHYNIGYSSYYLFVVVECREKYFECVK